MAKVKAQGREYELRMSLWATEQIENKYGDMKEALKKFQTEKKISMVRTMFAIMANAALKAAGKPMDVTEDALDNCSLRELSDVSAAMNQAMQESLHAETVDGGEADDRPADGYEAEYNEKNG